MDLRGVTAVVLEQIMSRHTSTTTTTPTTTSSSNNNTHPEPRVCPKDFGARRLLTLISSTQASRHDSGIACWDGKRAAAALWAFFRPSVRGMMLLSHRSSCAYGLTAM